MRGGGATVVLALLTFVSSSSTLAEAPPASQHCAQFEVAIENNLKQLALEDAEGIGDNSAPRATLSELKIQNFLLVISMNLQLMRDNGCPAKKEPISTARYMLPAMQCNTELLKVRLDQVSGKPVGSSGLPPACDISTWKPTNQATEEKP